MKLYVLFFGVMLTLLSVGALPCAKKGDKAQVDFAQIETALKFFKLDNGRYPSREEGLIVLVKLPAESDLESTYRKEGYLSELPLDQEGNMYLYELRNIKGEYQVYLQDRATGENSMSSLGSVK